MNAGVERNLLSVASQLRAAVKEYSTVVDRPREGVAAHLADQLLRMAQVVPADDVLKQIAGMDAGRVRDVREMAQTAMAYATQMRDPRLAVARSGAPLTDEWRADMLLAEDVIASARGLWRSEDEELEEEESTAMLPAALTDLRSMDAAAMQALQRCSEEHNALDEGVEKEAARGRLQRAVSRAQKNAQLRAVLATHKHGVTISFSEILGGVQGINLPLWHALQPGDQNFAIPDEMHACKNAFDTASRRYILFLRTFDARFRTRTFSEYKDIMQAQQLNVGTGRANPSGPVHILQPSADKIERRVQTLARCGADAAPKQYHKAFALKCDIESYLTKAMRLGDWAFGDEQEVRAEYNFMLRAIEALVNLNLRLIPTVYTAKCYPLTWHTRSWHLMGAEGHLPRLLLEMHSVGAFSARGTEQMQFIFRQLGLYTTRSGRVNTERNPGMQKLIKYIRSNAWRWSVPAMKTAAHQASLAGDKNRSKLKDDVAKRARAAVDEIFAKLEAAAQPGGECRPPPEITAAGDAAGEQAFDNVAAEQMKAHRKWKDELETCKLELQGKGRAPPSGKFVLEQSDKKANLKVADIKELYEHMQEQYANYVPPKTKMLRLDMEDAVCRAKLGEEPEVPDVAATAPGGGASAPQHGDPADWIFCTPEAWFSSRENFWIAANDAAPSDEICK